VFITKGWEWVCKTLGCRPILGNESKTGVFVKKKMREFALGFGITDTHKGRVAIIIYIIIIILY